LTWAVEDLGRRVDVGFFLPKIYLHELNMEERFTFRRVVKKRGWVR